MGTPIRTPDAAPSTFFAITKSDLTRLEGLQWLHVAGAGDLVLKGVENGAAAVTIAVADGEYIPFGAGYVMAATTATGIVGFA